MKRTIIICVLFLSACATNVQYGTDSTSNKNWLEIVSSKKDYKGAQYDSCYKFNFTVWPQAAAARLNKDHNCTTRCCWRSVKDTVVIDLNEGLAEEIAAKGKANKYTPGKITINVKYSSFLDLTNAIVSPSGAINRDGFIKLSYTEVTDTARLKEVTTSAKIAAEEAGRKAALLNASLAEERELEKARIADLQADYNKRMAVNYVRRFYGLNIDRYLASLDEQQRQRGYTLLFAQKEWTIVEAEGTYAVNCYAPASIGKTQKSMKNMTIECGLWLVDLDEQTVTPYNQLSRDIVK